MPPEYVMTEPSFPFTSLQNSSLARVLRGKFRAQDLANGRASESGVLGRRRATRAPRRGARRSSPRALSFALCSAMAADEEEALRPGPLPPRSQQSRPRPTGVPLPHRGPCVFSTGDGRGAGEEADQAPPAQAGYLLGDTIAHAVRVQQANIDVRASQSLRTWIGRGPCSTAGLLLANFDMWCAPS